ncbi:MAG: nuclear transport factor 2 family protein [Burkholderiales bacterium]|nr:nuclear transport factor 2 family protein [Burkholderiales bacterium]
MDFATYVEIQQLMADYWLRVDGLSTLAVEELFVEEGTLRLGAARCSGRKQIGEFYAERARRNKETQRMTRHVNSQWHFEPRPDGWKLTSNVQVIVGEGAIPMESIPPATVADFFDVVVRDALGRWRFRSRDADILFTGRGAAYFLKS